MLFNYDPFAAMEEREDLYYRAALSGFENLEEENTMNYMNKKIRKKLEAEHRLSIEQLADMVGVAACTLRTWISSYKFAKFIRYDDIMSETTKISIVLNKQFCKEFIPYLALKGLNKKNYVKNFCDSLEAIDYRFISE